MKAAVYRRYGAPDVVAIEDAEKPVLKDNEVLVRIRAATVSSADWRVRSLEVPRGYRLIMPLVFGVFGPRQKILGTEFSGDVEAVGKSVTRFKPGDAVFAFPGGAMGAHAEYRTMPEQGRVALKPANLGYVEAAALCFGGSTALHYLRDKAKLKRGERVLVIGASGAVGSAAVQIAKHFGAVVSGVCSAENAELVRSIGADETIDYRARDVRTGAERYDVIMDCVGDASFRTHGGLLNPGGRLVLIAAGLADTLSALGRKPEGKRVLAGPATENPEHLSFLKELAEAGAFRPVIDQVFPLAQIVAAHARVDTGHKRGSVVVEIQA
jgi:NADPH:quinone reductase-like Zn-dependent oxidoreductase